MKGLVLSWASVDVSTGATCVLSGSRGDRGPITSVSIIADGEFSRTRWPHLVCGKSDVPLRMPGPALEEVKEGRVMIGEQDVTDVPPKASRHLRWSSRTTRLYPQHDRRAPIWAFALKISGNRQGGDQEAGQSGGRRCLGSPSSLGRKPKALSGRSASAGRDGSRDRAVSAGVLNG